MTKLKNKCDSYNIEVEANVKLIKLKNVIAVLPAVFLAILGIALLIVTAVMKLVPLGGSFAFLIFVLAGLIYALVMYSVLNKKFDSNNQKIAQKFTEFYKVTSQSETTTLVADNKGVATKLNQYGPNQLYVYIAENALFFVTTSIYKLSSLGLRTTSIDMFEGIIKKDFGALVVPIDDIDNYKGVEVMVTFKESVLKLNFDTQKFLDDLIPTKDFYFNAHKKP